MKIKKLLLAGAAAAIAVAGGVAATGSASAQQDGQRLGQERRYERAGTVLDKPRQNDRAVVSAAAARSAAAKANGKPEGRGNAQARVELARFSDNMLHVPDENGQPRFLVQDVLAWVITTPDVPQQVYGNLRLSDADRAQLESVACDYVQVVDATSGDYLEAFQAC